MQQTKTLHATVCSTANIRKEQSQQCWLFDKKKVQVYNIGISRAQNGWPKMRIEIYTGRTDLQIWRE
jgi:hypothetical protein